MQNDNSLALDLIPFASRRHGSSVELGRSCCRFCWLQVTRLMLDRHHRRRSVGRPSSSSVYFESSDEFCCVFRSLAFGFSMRSQSVLPVCISLATYVHPCLSGSLDSRTQKVRVSHCEYYSSRIYIHLYSARPNLPPTLSLEDHQALEDHQRVRNVPAQVGETFLHAFDHPILKKTNRISMRQKATAGKRLTGPQISISVSSPSGGMCCFSIASFIRPVL